MVLFRTSQIINLAEKLKETTNIDEYGKNIDEKKTHDIIKTVISQEGILQISVKYGNSINQRTDNLHN